MSLALCQLFHTFLFVLLYSAVLHASLLFGYEAVITTNDDDYYYYCS